MSRRVSLLLAILLLLPISSVAAQSVSVTDNSPPEVLLAFIDTNQNPVPQRLVNQYADLLDTLNPRCTERRSMISDMAVRATQLLEDDYGTSVSVRFFLRQLRDATEGIPRRECSELVAALIVMIGEDG